MSDERQQLNINSPWWGEHVHRYKIALKHIQEQDKVLDIACGTGFGTELIFQKTKGVIGGDLDNETIESNKKHYSGISFETMNVTKTTYSDDYFDVIVSFETIEHTTQYREMLKELKRITKKGGIVIISTPNFYLNSPKGIIINPFHTQEFTPKEFKELIGEYFSEFEHYGQKYIRYDNKTSFRYKAAYMMERFFYQRGIRKLPLSFQNFFLKLFINKTQYPNIEDFDLTQDIDVIEKKCVTQLVICKND